MRWLVSLCLLSSVAHADLPDKYAKAAREAFEHGRKLDEAGDLDEALKQYKRAYEIAPHPFVLYNMADIQRRLRHYREAIEAYELYLTFDGVRDREAVKKIITELRALPGTLHVTMDGPDGIVFVDGKRVGTAPLDVKVTEGTHLIDVVSPITHGYMPCAVRAGRENTCRVSAKARVDGNVVISGPWPMGGRSYSIAGPGGDKVRVRLRGRAPLPPGHYPDLEIFDKQCAPVPLDVPKGDERVTFVYATPTPQKQCTDVAITVQRVF